MLADLLPTLHEPDAQGGGAELDDAVAFDPAGGFTATGLERAEPQRLPRRACSRSIASKSALKFPPPKPRAPCRSITSKKRVGRSCAVFVKIWSREPSSSRSARMRRRRRSSHD